MRLPKDQLLMASAIAALFLGSATTNAQEIPIIAGAPWAAWSTTTVDSGPTVFQYVTIALDSSGNPVIAYTVDDDSDIGIKIARYDGLFWQLSWAQDGGISSLALDSSDRPHISFSSLAFALVYAYFDGASWVSETVDSNGNAGGWSTLRLDSQGWPHVSYNAGGTSVRYAYKDQNGWHIETVATGASIFSSLDLGANNEPHIAYVSIAENPQWGRPHYLRRNSSGSWVDQVVETNGGNKISIAVDTLDRPHLSYRGINEVLKHAVLDQGSWIVTTVDSDSPTGWYSCLDTDSENRPHIAYWQVLNRGNPDDPTRGHLKYATISANGDWVTEHVDPKTIAQGCSITVDDDSRPRIAYMIWRHPLLLTHTIDFHLAYAEPASASTLGRVGL